MHPTHKPADQPAVSPADVLRAAALYLDRHGWHQGDLYAEPAVPTPPASMVGAIQSAARTTTGTQESNDTAALIEATIEYLADLLCRPTHGGDRPARELLALFNDHPTTTAREAITVLNAAAYRWDHTYGGAQ